MPRDIDRKLRATAAVLGLSARKDLAAAFRRVNAARHRHVWMAPVLSSYRVNSHRLP
jgi:hypothetical protein